MISAEILAELKEEARRAKEEAERRAAALRSGRIVEEEIMSSDKRTKKQQIVAYAVMAAMPVLALWRGFVVGKLWGWFGVPIGLPPISTWHAYGLTILVSMMTWAPKRPRLDGKDEEYSTEVDMVMETAWQFLVPTVGIVFGAVLHFIGGVP